MSLLTSDRRTNEKKKSTSGWKSRAMHIEDIDEDVKRVFGDKNRHRWALWGTINLLHPATPPVTWIFWRTCSCCEPVCGCAENLPLCCACVTGKLQRNSALNSLEILQGTCLETAYDKQVLIILIIMMHHCTLICEMYLHFCNTLMSVCRGIVPVWTNLNIRCHFAQNSPRFCQRQMMAL